MTEQAITLYRRSELQAVDEGCLHRYHEIWVKGTDDMSDIALVGITCHAIKFRYIQKLVELQIEADSELAQAAFFEGIAFAQAPPHLIPEIREIWERHAEVFELDLKHFITAEEKQTTEGGVTFTPDRVEANTRINELEIHDDKWGWAPPLSDEEVKSLFQARVYSLMARERWPGFSSYRFIIHAIRFNRSSTATYTAAELDQIEREVRAHIGTIERAKETGHWPAVAGPACRFCALACPLMDQTPAVMPKRLLEASQAVSLGSWVLAAEQMLKAAKKALKGYASAHGPISVQGIVYDNRPSQERKYRIDAVLEALRLNNIAGAFEDPKQEGLTISHSALKKLFKIYPQVERDLELQVIEKVKYRFSAKQPKSGDEPFGDDEGDD